MLLPYLEIKVDAGWIPQKNDNKTTKNKAHNLLSKRQDIQSKRITRGNGKFRPSPTKVLKIMHVLMCMDFIERTLLARKARINYTDMINHLEWMEKKKIISITLENGKIMIKLSSRWREFAEMQMELYGM